MKLTSEASIQIQKPLAEVYEAIVDPRHMTHYFIAESTGRLETGIDVKWKFPEFEERFPIRHVRLQPHRSLSFIWDPETVVDLSLSDYNQTSTLVNVKEGPKEYNEENLKWLISNTAGWSNCLACLKAYLEHGINLRLGAYDFMRKD